MMIGIVTATTTAGDAATVMTGIIRGIIGTVGTIATVTITIDRGSATIIAAL
jgi:hypothetical protein